MKRTIQTTPSRSRQLALAAVFLDLPDGESVIQYFITAGILSLASHDETYKLALLRAAGVDWSDLEKVSRES